MLAEQPAASSSRFFYTFYYLICLTEPYTVVLGGPDMHVDQGSTINLTCVSKFNPTPPSDVTWYLNGKVSLA